MALLDPTLEVLIAKIKYNKENPDKEKLALDFEKVLNISIHFSGDLETLEEIGFQKGNRVGNFVYGTILLKDLPALAKNENVIRIEKQRKSRLNLDGSIPDINADEVWTRSGNRFNGYNGEGVIVGVIDTGIDFRHKAFRNPDDNTTRILKIWDQTLQATPDEDVPGPITDVGITGTDTTNLGYGVEYSAAAIDNTLTRENPTVPVRHVDTDGHGTHVAGIAAGDGSQNGRCKGEFSYIGVAPRASLIVVRLWGLTDGDSNAPSSPNSRMIDAIRYIISEASKITPDPLPVAINLSVGRFTENMDGTSIICQTIDTILTNNSQRNAIIFSGGNNANKRFHAQQTVPGNTTDTVELHFEVPDDDESRTVMIFYSGNNIQMSLQSPIDGSNGFINFVSSGNSPPPNTTANGTGGSVSIIHNPNRITIQITPPTGANAENVSGEWTLTFRNSNTTPTAIDAYCLYGSEWSDHHFTSDLTTRSTLGEYASCIEAISVGSYEVGNGLASSSARGPTFDARTKPDICAPGVAISAPAISSERTDFGDYLLCNCCCDCCADFYVDKSGTSMAAPHVTGLVALMLQKNPNLTHSEIKALLINNTQPIPSGETANERLGWGTGKIDAKAVLDATTEVNPPVTGTGVTAFTGVQNDTLIDLQERFLGTERGAQLWDLAKNYFEEVRMMINSNKRVATVWHRCQGPAWIRLSIRAFYSPEQPIPEIVNGINFYDALSRIKEIIKRYASEELLADINKHESELMFLPLAGGLNEMIDHIGNGKKYPIMPNTNYLTNSY